MVTLSIRNKTFGENGILRLSDRYRKDKKDDSMDSEM